MSAQEVIDQIRTLPPAEKEKVLEYLHQDEARPEMPGTVQYIDRPTLEKSAKQVFDHHNELFKKLAQ